MSSHGKLLKIYIDETKKWQGQALYNAITLKLKELGVAGVTVSRGIVGYGSDSIVHRARVLELSADLPIVIEAIDTEDKITQVLPEITKMVDKGLIITIDIDIEKSGKNQ